MSSKILASIGDEMRRIAGSGGPADSFPVMSGKVLSVDEAAGTCTVKLSVDEEEAPTEGVLLNSVSANNNGQLLIPAKDSQVWVAEIDGPGKWGLVKCSNLLKMVVTVGGMKLTIKDGETCWGDGSLGGITKTQELKKQLDKTTMLLNAVIAVLNGPPVPEPGLGSPSALQTALKTALVGQSLGDFSNIENKKITHA